MCDCFDYELEEQAVAEPEPEKIALPVRLVRTKKK